MILIVMSHADDWTGLAELYQTDVCVNKFIADWLNLGGQIGVGCFLLISGYFMVDQQFNLKRIFRLLGEVWFYSLSIWCIYIAGKIASGTFGLSSVLDETLRSFFPVLLSRYWFVTAYVILMFMAPFFNQVISMLDKRAYQLLLATLIVIFFVLEGGIPKALFNMADGRIVPVFIMYFVAGYIKKHVDNNKNNFSRHLIIAISGYALLYLSCIMIGVIGDALDNPSIIRSCYNWRALNSPIVLLINVELFLAFLRMKTIRSRVINSLAGNTFGVYLIHNNTVINKLYLPKIFPIYQETNSLLIFIFAVGSVAAVYFACTLIDMVRQRTVEKAWLKLLDAKCGVFEAKIKKMITGISERVMKAIKSYYG